MLSKYVLPRWLNAPEGTPATPPTTTPAATVPPQSPGDINPRTPPDDPPPKKEGEDEPPADPPASLSGKDDPLLKDLIAAYKGEEDPKPVEPAPPEKTQAEKDKEAADAAAAEAAKTATPPATPAAAPKKGARKSILPEEDAPLPPPAAPPAAVTPPPAAPADADEQYIAGLTEEQKDELAEAEFAAKLYPNKYANRRKELLDYYRRVDATANRLLTEKSGDEGFNISEDEVYKRTLNSKPRMDAAEQKRVLRQMGAQEGAKLAREEFTPELQQVKRSQDEIQIAPTLDKVATNFVQVVQGVFASDGDSVIAPLMKVFKEKGFEEAAKEFPLESEIVSEEVTRGQQMAKEYIRIVRMAQKGHSVFDQSNPLHTDIVEFINSEGDRFVQSGSEQLMRNGKKFLPRAEYAALAKQNPNEAAKHWTFSDEHVVNMIPLRTKRMAEDRIKAEEERAAKRGFVRAKPSHSAVPPNQPGNEPQPITPPKVTTPVAKGNATAPKPNPEEINVASLYK